MRTWIDVAVLTKTKSLDGSFVVRGTAGLPFLLVEGMQVAFVPPQTDVTRTAVVASIDDIDEKGALVSFEGIDDPASANALVGCHCLVRRADIGDDVFVAQPQTWQGLHVSDAKFGPIGCVVDVIDNPGQSLLAIADERPGAQEGRTVLVPVVDEFVREVDISGGTVLIDIPEDLLNL